MARTPKDKKNDIEIKICSKCGIPKKLGDYYLASSDLIHSDNRLHICKDCLESVINFNDVKSVIDIMRRIDRPFLTSEYEASLNTTNKVPFREYMRRLAMPQNRSLTFNESDYKGKENNKDIEEYQYEIIDKKSTLEFDNQDKKDVVRMLGYDPFEFENEEDKLKLYADLINYLDESTLEDGFKLSAIIQIVKGFNQIDKIDEAITQITNDPNKMATNSGGIKTLVATKKDILSSLLNLAKDNGISVNHNNNKSKGGNTLNGIVKKLNEIGLSSAEINLFDLETCDAIKQIADVSNRSILEQLMLDENDYTDMISQQRDMITSLDNKLIKCEEDNRLLKVEIAKLKGELKTFDIENEMN